jgi:PAS domain S-box
MKILVAEDHAESRYLLQQLFSGLGHEVSAVADGLEALEQLERDRGAPFDVIVSDALMPRMDGFRLCREIRRHPRWCGLPFIFYTATYTERGDEQMAMKLGADRFILKPEEPARLMELIQETVAKVKAAPPRAPQSLQEDGAAMQEYTERLSLKLERKVAELEGLNEDLRRSEREVRELNERLTATVRALETEARERREAERRLRFREHLLSHAERIGRVGSWERLGETRELLVSDEACRIFGVAPGTSLTLDWIRNHVHEGERERVLKAWDEADGSAEYFECEYTLIRDDGSACPLSMKRRVFCDESGTERYVGVMQDLTERRRAEAEQARLEAQLRQAQKMEAMGNLAGGIAHDFNNILTAIMAHAELLDLELPRTAPSQLRESVTEILTASTRAQEMVRQILTFSRKQPVERKRVQIDGVVAEALRLVRMMLPSTVGLRHELHAHRAVLANEAQIHQVVMNLCTNAAHAITGNEGSIVVTLGVADLSESGAAVRPPLKAGEYVLLEVRDNGSGMDPSVAERIFEPFFTTKDVGDGTGLGLAVVHGIVQAHDGAIFVESLPGRGTIFSIYLPALSLEESRPGMPPSLPAGEGERILFVDDEPSVARIGARLLEKLGYVVEAVSDPVQAKERFTKDPQAFDLVITDYLMPRMTGLDLATAVKAMRPDIPMILAVGFGGQLDATTARERGFGEFVTKPFAMQALADAVNRALGKSAAAQ